MSDEIAPVLNQVAAFLFVQAEQDPAASGKFGPAAVLLLQLADSVDGRASSHLAQAETIRAILEDTQRIMPPAAADELAALVPPPPTAAEDFHARQLGAYLEGMKAVLIAAHAWLETSGTAGREMIIERIWDYLHQLAKHEGRLISPMW